MPVGVPEGIYPFSTQDGKAIPLDIIKPRAVIVQPYLVSAGATFQMPSYAVVGVLMSDTGCLVRFGEEGIVATPGMPITDCIIVPAGGIITTVLTPGDVHVLGLAKGGTLYIQLIEQWAAMGLATQYGRK